MTAMSKMLYMVIERFKEGAAPEIDQRFRGVAVLAAANASTASCLIRIAWGD
jgi:hypothetical protein